MNALVRRDDDDYPDLDGCVRLVAAMWEQVHEDLRLGWAPGAGSFPGLQTFWWLHTPEFDSWVAATTAAVTPAKVREMLMGHYWPEKVVKPVAPEPDEPWEAFKRRARLRAPFMGY